MTQLVDPDLDQRSALHAPALFTGEETVIASRIVATSTTAIADEAWADGVVAGLGPGERALVSLSFTPGGPAVAHRLQVDATASLGSVGPVNPVGSVDPPSPVDLAGSGPVTGFAVAQERGARGEEPSSPTAHRVTEVPPVAEYAERVRVALRQIDQGKLEKVVLGRCLDIVSEPPLDGDAVIARLIATRPGRYVFGLPLSAQPDAPLLLGASPELLVRRHGSAVTSFPLAGSVPRAEDRDEDRRRAASLRASAKDLAEHAFVVESIIAALEPWCAQVQAVAEPVLVSTDTLHHLGTPITARLDPGLVSGLDSGLGSGLDSGLGSGRGTAPTALHLARLLQPTPAVGGVPARAALDLIDQLEGDRGPLAGAVGWVDAHGDGEFAVTIRAGVLNGERLRLFAGAGIVNGSDPEAEVRETGAKLTTMMRAVGL